MAIVQTLISFIKTRLFGKPRFYPKKRGKFYEL
nr:MAG TPA: hypothetical protein [Caudoviricetes sp.]